MKSAVHTVVDSATVSPTVQNWRQYRTNRRRTSDARTTWRRAPPTGRAAQIPEFVGTETTAAIGELGVGTAVIMASVVEIGCCTPTGEREH